MKEFFLKQLKRLEVSQKTKILLAVSGGVDSMVLMHLFYQYGYNFSIAHCNFSLRGSESDEDQKLIQSFTKANNLQFFSKKFNTASYAKKNKISIQMAARELRYTWLKSIKKKYNFKFIATAHHKNDSVETLLINLIRGTGVSGLHGIQELDKIIRPLLKLEKYDLIKYAKQHNIDYREDSSNSDDKYVRNKIRNKIIPLMQEINPNVIDSISKTILKVRDVETIYKQFLINKKNKLLIQSNGEYRINIELLLKEPASKQLLYEIISDFHFHDVDAVFKSLSSDSGKEFSNSNFYMIKDRNELIISKHILNNRVIINENTKSVKIPFKIKLSINDYSNFDIKKEVKNRMYIDYSKLHFPLLIRPWIEGDRFIPLGMKGYKKLSDYFIDKKYSLIKKKKTRLLISNNRIVCILGERLDDRFKLVENSKKVYIVES